MVDSGDLGADVATGDADGMARSGAAVFRAEVGIWYPGTLCPFDCFGEPLVQGKMSRELTIAELQLDGAGAAASGICDASGCRLDMAALWELFTQVKSDQVTVTFVGDAQWPKEVLGVPLTFQRNPEAPTIWKRPFSQIVIDEANARIRIQFVELGVKLCGATYSASITP
ncbi:MAG: hypothetical protein HY696_07610 [Deltaproteobacteria bacterium]|nr:hypothetical protein [Deltaproteobacteria bacterium]